MWQTRPNVSEANSRFIRQGNRFTASSFRFVLLYTETATLMHDCPWGSHFFLTLTASLRGNGETQERIPCLFPPTAHANCFRCKHCAYMIQVSKEFSRRTSKPLRSFPVNTYRQPASWWSAARCTLAPVQLHQMLTFKKNHFEDEMQNGCS